MPLAHLPSPPSIFPTYLIPSIPFRRRKSSNDSTTSTTSTVSTNPTSEPDTSSTTPTAYLNGHSSHLRCSRCLADLCLSTQIISKGFTGRHGRAYLVSALPNTNTHKPVPRTLVTGAHTVSDISCAQCGSVLGWKYVAAAEESQRYKVGKFILETRKVCRSSCWENEEEDGEGAAVSPVDAAVEELGGVGVGRSREAEGGGGGVGEAVEFDSQDEDECEDLFAGVWSPALARRRRKSRRFSAIGHS
ncbi:yippee-domain-containing protein [Viridothelium virens]|uniref:Yippee-domain-containing protein n=1 Tax=Viridothelium virens TaxID=1048519 RepID=A0A6A6HE05_VIRVR|nr:yippee-domain-containing protein [Viridothelium virens]